MENRISKNEFELIRDYILTHCGIELSSTKDYLVEAKLRDLVIETSSNDFGEFYRKITKENSPQMRNKIIDAITTNETQWFRDESMWMVLREKIFNTFFEKARKKEKNTFSIWCAACSTGQEPYSIAMIISELLSYYKDKIDIEFNIFATDISPSVLFLAKRGIYDNISISRGLPENMKKKYFDKFGNIWKLKAEIKDMVKFFPFNLQNSFSPLGKFDLVLLRNVLIYFSNELKTDIYSKTNNVLNKDGFLIVGSSESVINSTTHFTMNDYKNGVYYTKKMI